MANIPETPEWTESIIRIEENDKVLGGENGVVNEQAQQLANRTQSLKQQVEAAAQLAAQADGKADDALGQIANIEAAAGSAAASSVSALQSKQAAEAAAALAGQSQQNAAADAAQAHSNATYAVQAAGTALGKAAEASTSATVAQGAANLAVGARDAVLGARDQAVAAAAAAAANADLVAADKIEIRNKYYGPLPDDPTTRPDGSPMQAGDEYHNTTTGNRMVYQSGSWVSVLGGLAADLANTADATKGAGMVGGIIRTVDTVSAMQSTAGLVVGQKVQTLGYGSIGDGKGAEYEIVPAGTGTADGYNLIGVAGAQARRLKAALGALVEVSHLKSYVGFTFNGQAWSSDNGVRLYLMPPATVTSGTGPALKMFADPYHVDDVNYRDLGVYYNANQEGDTGYNAKGVFYTNVKTNGTHYNKFPDYAITFQDGLYQALKASMVDGLHPVVVMGKRNPSGTGAYHKTQGNCLDLGGFIAMDNYKGIRWWGNSGGYTTNISHYIDPDTSADVLNFNMASVTAASISRSGAKQGLVVNTRVVARQVSLTSGVTFSVAGFSSAILNYASPATLSALNDALPGQEVTLISASGNVTIPHNATIRLKKGADYLLPADSAIKLIFTGSKWVEIGQSS